jgi:RNA polymerase sigma factor (sigma-70 family)
MGKQSNLNKEQINNTVLAYIKSLSKPDTSINEIADETGLDKSQVSESVTNLSKIGEFFFIFNVLKPGVIHITHIDGKEIEWQEEELDEIGNGLFDREGNIFINPNEFFDYISTLPASTKHENEILFKELEKLRGDEHAVKVLEIATKNIKLIRRLTFAVIENEELTESEVREYYGYVLRGLCRAVEKFDYKTGYSLSTLANQWILQGSTRARSKIIQKRMKDKYKTQVGIQAIDERFREIKNNTDKYPNFTELMTSFEVQLKDKIKEEEERKAQLLEDIENRRGINRLYNLLFHKDKDNYSHPWTPASSSVEAMAKSREFLKGKDKIFNSLKLLDEKEREIIVFRYGLYEYLDNYNISLDNFSKFDNKFIYIEEKGMTLEEIGQLYGHTRERVRQIEKIALSKMEFYISDKEVSKEIPLGFFPQTFNKFFELNNLKTIEDITSLNLPQLSKLKGSTASKVNFLVRGLKKMGFEPEQIKLKDGDIDFSQLSVRSTNALRRVGITTKQELIDTDIELITNIGEKSVRELHEYLGRDLVQKEQPKKYANIQTAVLFPCANSVSQENFQHTMKNKISLKNIESHLLPKQKETLATMGEEFYFWGIKSTSDKGWDNINIDAAGLFFANKEVFAVGTIIYKFINPQLADYFWSPENITNRSYKYMFAFSNLEKVSIPQLKVNQTIGFKANYVTQGFMGLNKIRSRDIVNLLNTYSN